MIVVSNFDAANGAVFELKIPASIISRWALADGTYTLSDQLYGATQTMAVTDGVGVVKVELQALQSFIWAVR